MKITYYGHYCFGIETRGKELLFDPFIRGNDLAKHIDFNSIKADYILLSHGHADHVSDVEAIARKNEVTLISNYEIVEWFGKKGIHGHPLNHGGKAVFDFGICKYVNAVHTSGLPDGSYGGAPGGFVISNDEGTFYFAGDTALTMDMKLIGEYSPPDFAILPIGDNFTMGVDDAVIASDFIKCDKIIGAHYDTFPFIVIDKDDAKRQFSEAGKELILLEIGTSLRIGY
ncbi:MAG: metal-dependent hydrolase [Cyclobacteriaceae bacterium]|nr:metal-dependent hydrolase [Cyclobacteriaceae bacterium]